jgi:hypothetical protein
VPLHPVAIRGLDNRERAQTVESSCFIHVKSTVYSVLSAVAGAKFTQDRHGKQEYGTSTLIIIPTLCYIDCCS